MSKKAYEILLEEHKLTIAELPADAQTGIRSIKEIERVVSMAEKGGKKVATHTMDKIRSLDKWVVREILDFVEDKETNSSAPPVSAEKIIAEIKKDEKAEEVKEETPAVEVDPRGVKCDLEFAALLKDNKTELTLEQVKEFAPYVYSLIFDNHTNDLENGITTTHYIISETTTNNFKLVKR